MKSLPNRPDEEISFLSEGKIARIPEKYFDSKPGFRGKAKK
jgi:hypothetical protein